MAEVLVALNGRGDLYVGWGCYALFGKCRPAGESWTDRFTVSPDSGVEVLSRWLPSSHRTATSP